MSFLFGGQTDNRPTRLSGMALQAALYGRCRPVLFGSRRVSTNLIWYGGFTSKQVSQGGKGFGGKGGSNYAYRASILSLMCEGPITGLDSVWDQNGCFQVAGVTEAGTVPASPPYTYDVTNYGPNVYNNDYGSSYEYSYSHSINNYGNPNGAQTITGTADQPLTKVAGAPGPGEYSVDVNGKYTFNAAQAGKTFSISYSYYQYRIVEHELSIVPNTPPYRVTVTNQTHFTGDFGVLYYPGGAGFKRVSGTPTLAGTYNPNGGAWGIYEFAAADAGQAVEITYSWNNPNTDQNAPTQLSLTLIEGTQGQSPWAYLTSKYPGQAVGYSGCAMIGSANLYLGYSPNTPNYTFEVSGPLIFGGGWQDANPADCIYQILTNTMYGIGFDSDLIDDSLAGNTEVVTGVTKSGGNAVYAYTGSGIVTGQIVTVVGCTTTGNNLSGVRVTADSAGTFTVVNATAFTEAEPATCQVSISSVRDYWTANSFFISDFMDSQSTVASIIGKYCEAGQVWCYWSEGKLKFTPLGDTSAVANGVFWNPPTNPVVSLDDSDYMAKDDPVKVSRTPWQDAYNKVQVQYSVRINNYNKDTLTAEDDAAILRFGLRIEGPKSYDFICEQDPAQFAANLRLQRLTTIRNTYEVEVKSIYPYLEPGDVIEIKDPVLFGTDVYLTPILPNTIPVRIMKIVDDPRGGIRITAEDYPFSIGSAVLYPKPAGDPSGDPTISTSTPDNTYLLVIEPPAAASLQLGNALYLYACGEGTNWGGCDIYYSYDDTNWNFLTHVDVPARIGTTTADLAVGTDPDTVNVLSVEMTSPDAELLSVPTGSADALVTLSALLGGAVPSPGSGTAPGVVQTTEGSIAASSGTTVTLTLGATPTPGNLLVLMQVGYYGGAVDVITPPAGFTAGYVPAPDTTTFPVYMPSNAGMWTRIVAGGDGVSWTVTLGAGYHYAHYFVLAELSGAGVPTGAFGLTAATGGGYTDYTTPVVAVTGGAAVFSLKYLAKSGSASYFTSASPPFYSLLSQGEDVAYMWGVDAGAGVTVPASGVSDTVTSSYGYEAYLNVVIPVGGSSTAAGQPPTKASQTGGYNGWNNANGVLLGSPAPATAVLYGSNANVNQSNMLNLYGFDFSGLPSDAVIVGATLTIDAEQTAGTSWCGFDRVYLLGVASSTNHAPPYPDNPLTGARQTFTFGGSADTWGVPGGLTLAIVQSGAFGAQVGFQCTQLPGTGADVSVFSATLSLSYLSATGQGGKGGGTVAGTMELIAYETADLSGPQTYALSYLRRGQYTTPIMSLATGSIFVRMDEASYKMQFNPKYIGSTIYFKALSTNTYGQMMQSLADVSSVALLLNGMTGAYDLSTGAPTQEAPVQQAPANQVVAGPASGAKADVALRSLVQPDIPNIDCGVYT